MTTGSEQPMVPFGLESHGEPVVAHQVERRRPTSPMRAINPVVAQAEEAEQERFVVSSPLPMLVISLPDRRVRTANRAAADLVDMTLPALLHCHLEDLLDPAQASLTVAAVAALDLGAVDSYRAQRTFVGSFASTHVSIWVRSIPRKAGHMAVILVMPEDRDSEFHSPTRVLMGPLAVDLASGTMDKDGKILSMSKSNAAVLHSQRGLASGTYNLLSQVHTDDQSHVWAAIKQIGSDHHDIVLSFRLRHSRLGWIASQCHLFATGDDASGEPIGFVLAEATARPPASGRIAQLEQHLGRIAAEAQAAGFTSSEQTGDRPPIDLGQLTARQREIVNRLLDGARVQTIAAALFVSPSTVRNHLSGVYRVFGVHSQAELIELLRPAD